MMRNSLEELKCLSLRVAFPGRSKEEASGEIPHNEENEPVVAC